MAKASEAAVRAAAAKYWGPNVNDVNMAVEIARIESGFNLTAHNPIGRDDSFGAMQVNMKGRLGEDRRAKYGLASNEQLYDLDTNMRVAHGIWAEDGKLGARTFFGTDKWWTSAIAAATKLQLTGLAGQDGADDEDEDEPYPPLTPAEQAIWDALPAEIRDFYTNQPLNIPYQFLERKPNLTDEQWNVIKHKYLLLQHGAGVLDDIGIDIGNPIGTLLDWTEALGKLLSTLLDPQFWKRIGIGVLGAAVIAIAIVFFTKSTVTNTVKDSINE